MPTLTRANRAICGEFQAKVGMPAGSALRYPCRRWHGYRLLHTAGRLAFHARRAVLRLQHDWPWAQQLATVSPTPIAATTGRLTRARQQRLPNASLPTPPVATAPVAKTRGAPDAGRGSSQQSLARTQTSCANTIDHVTGRRQPSIEALTQDPG
jgi:hypothetical protein